jgi:hypothetical protein
MVADVMLRAFGPAGAHIHHRKHLTGQFNGHLEDLALLVADEAFWSGDPVADSVLKGLITDSELYIERKGQDAYRAQNRMSLMILANADTVVAATADERRYFVVDVSDERRGDHTYFTRLAQWVKDGGVATWLHYLMNRDLSEFNPRTTIRTVALLRQIEAGLETIPSVLYQLARDGQCVSDRIGDSENFSQKDWPNDGFTIKTNELREYVVSVLRGRGSQVWEPGAVDQRVGRAVKLLGGRRARPRRPEGRTYEYSFPGLHTAREAWAENHEGPLEDWFNTEEEDGREGGEPPF